MEEEKNEFFKNWFLKFKKNYKFIFFSVLFFILVVLIDHLAGTYVTEKGSASVTDIILSNFGPYNLSFLFVYYWLFVLSVFVLYPLIFKIKSFHKVFNQLSFLIILRSFFISLTHLKASSSIIPISYPFFLNFFAFQNDLFFSGHVAIPFLAFLIYKKDKIRWFFLASSILLGIVSLLMHQHYTIDVLSAFFITYGSFKMVRYLFPKLF